jgi:hypothetical protein
MAAVLGVSCACGTPILYGGQSQGTSVDYAAPPESLERLVKDARVIVRVRVGQSKQRIAYPSENPIVLREHDVEILDLLEGDGTLEIGKRILVSQPGGKLDVGGRQFFTTLSMRPLEPDDDAILFLNVWTAAKTFSIAYGSVGALLVKNDTVEIPKAVRDISPFAEGRTVPVAQFINVVRQLVVQKKLSLAKSPSALKISFFTDLSAAILRRGTARSRAQSGSVVLWSTSV